MLQAALPPAPTGQKIGGPQSQDKHGGKKRMLRPSHPARRKSLTDLSWFLIMNDSYFIWRRHFNITGCVPSNCEMNFGLTVELRQLWMEAVLAYCIVIYCLFLERLIQITNNRLPDTDVDSGGTFYVRIRK